MKASERARWYANVSVIAASVFLAILFAGSGALEQFITQTQQVRLIGSLVAGFFFSSVFTVAPAIVALGEIAQHGSLMTTALVGGFGAMMADMLIFRFLKANFGSDIAFSARHAKSARFMHLMRSSGFHWALILLGGLIIASPFPDELGLALMGITRVRLSLLMPLSFTFNTLGILAIGLVARGIT